MTHSLGFDPDVTRHDDAAYWAAALVLALQAGNTPRINKARRQLRRLGFDFVAAAPRTRRRSGKGARHAK